MIDGAVDPLDQVFPVTDDDVRTTFPPVQKVVGPPAETVGVGSDPESVSVWVSVFETQPGLLVNTKL